MFLGRAQAERAGREMVFAAISFATGFCPNDALPGFWPQQPQHAACSVSVADDSRVDMNSFKEES